MDSMTILQTTNSGIQFLDPSINRVLYTTVRGQFVALFIIVLLQSPASCQTAPPPPPPPSSPTDLKPGFGVVVLVLTILIFFMSFCSVYIRHCNDGSSAAGGHLSAAMTGRSRRGHRGLDPAVIETFPIFKYSAVKEMKIGKGELECAVCLNEFEDDETLRFIPKCDHVFHAECIDMWLESHATCPVCRANLYPDPGESTEPPLLGQISPTAQRPNQTGTGNQNDDVAIDVPRQLAVSGDSMEQPLYGRNRRRPPWLVRSRTRGNVSGRRRWFGYFLRSRSTGHVAVEDMERFTLRLPDDVRRHIIGGKLSRTTSCVALSTDGSYRAANRSGFGGSYREGRFDWADRWAFTLTPPFISAAPKTAPPDGLRTTQVSQLALPPV